MTGDGRLWYHHASRHLNPARPAHARTHRPQSSHPGLAHSSRTWRGARTPRAMKRVRQDRAQARRQPATAPIEGQDARRQGGRGRGRRRRRGDASRRGGPPSRHWTEAAKAGAIHHWRCRSATQSRPDAQGQRRARGSGCRHRRQVVRTTGKAAAAREAKARIAASKASRRPEGEQTAAGKARAAPDQVDPGRGRPRRPGRSAIFHGQRPHPPRRARPRRQPSRLRSAASTAKAPATKAAARQPRAKSSGEEGTDGEGRLRPSWPAAKAAPKRPRPADASGPGAERPRWRPGVGASARALASPLRDPVAAFRERCRRRRAGHRPRRRHAARPMIGRARR